MQTLPGRPTSRIRKIKDIRIAEEKPRSILLKYFCEMEDDSEVRITLKVSYRGLVFRDPYKNRIKEIETFKFSEDGKRSVRLNYFCKTRDDGELHIMEGLSFGALEQKMRLKKRDIEVEIIPKE